MLASHITGKTAELDYQELLREASHERLLAQAHGPLARQTRSGTQHLAQGMSQRVADWYPRARLSRLASGTNGLVGKGVAVLASLLVVGALAASGGGSPSVSAQETTQERGASHPLVGAWMVDTNTETDTDSPEIGIFTSDGSVFGLGASRWVSGVWDADDDTAGNATMVGVFEGNGGGYVVLRGIHAVDASGDAWSCDCTFTVVAPDGTVLASGAAPALAHRIPLQGIEQAGQGLADMPRWAPVMAATPAP